MRSALVDAAVESGAPGSVHLDQATAPALDLRRRGDQREDADEREDQAERTERAGQRGAAEEVGHEPEQDADADQVPGGRRLEEAERAPPGGSGSGCGSR